jgi:hypothetical protein
VRTKYRCIVVCDVVEQENRREKEKEEREREREREREIERERDIKLFNLTRKALN